MIQSLCVVVGRPQGVELSALGLREAWAAHAYAIETRMLFFDDGIYNLLKNPGYFGSMLKDLIDENGEVFCLRESLAARGIRAEELVEGVRLISKQEVADIIEECDAVNVF
jgi:sulfur relay protein TusB/DsrH